MMAAAAAATTLRARRARSRSERPRRGSSPRRTRPPTSYELTPHMVSVAFTVLGEPCRLVQLVPNAFIVKMTRALAELEAETASGTGCRHEATACPATRCAACRCGCGPSWAAPGCRSASAVSLPPGAVVDLDGGAGRARAAVRQRRQVRQRAAAAGRQRVGGADRRGAARDRPDRQPRRKSPDGTRARRGRRRLHAKDAWRRAGQGRPRGGRRGCERQRGRRAVPGAAPRHHDPGHHHAREGRPDRPQGDPDARAGAPRS